MKVAGTSLLFVNAHLAGKFGCGNNDYLTLSQSGIRPVLAHEDKAAERVANMAKIKVRLSCNSRGVNWADHLPVRSLNLIWSHTLIQRTREPCQKVKLTRHNHVMTSLTGDLIRYHRSVRPYFHLRRPQLPTECDEASCGMAHLSKRSFLLSLCFFGSYLILRTVRLSERPRVRPAPKGDEDQRHL